MVEIKERLLLLSQFLLHAEEAFTRDFDKTYLNFKRLHRDEQKKTNKVEDRKISVHY